MAINAYCGVMGSGKSYEVVQGPLLEAIEKGRRVVTNVDGINQSLIHDYLVAKRRGHVEDFGTVIHVRTDDMLKSGFFPREVESSDGAIVETGFVQAGDLLVVDEAWKLWASDKKITDEHMSFFRMHRHFTHPETGVACDVVLMIQGIGDLHRKLKEVVELSFRMHKLKSLGLASGYRVEQYEGWKQNARTRVGTYVRKYSKDVFPLYKSYAGVGGNEAVVDKRQNILTNKKLWLVCVFFVLMGSVSVRFLWSFLHRPPHGEVASGSSPAAGVDSSREAAPNGVSGRSSPVFSRKWRIVGSYCASGRTWIVLSDVDGRFRVESPSMFENSGIAMVGSLDGEKVSTFSGGRPLSVAGSGGLVPSEGASK